MVASSVGISVVQFCLLCLGLESMTPAPCKGEEDVTASFGIALAHYFVNEIVGGLHPIVCSIPLHGLFQLLDQIRCLAFVSFNVLCITVYDDIGNDQQQKNKSHQAAYLHK